MKLTLRTKLLGGFATVLLLMGSALAVGIFASANETAISERIVNHLDPARLAALKIVTLVRSIDDDGAWVVNSMSGDKRHSDELLATYYAEVDQLQTTLSQAETLADTEAQVAAVASLRQRFWGSKPLTAADRATLDDQSRQVFSGSDGYLFGNEQAFALARSGKYLEAAFSYTTVPFVGALDAAQQYIDVVQGKIDQAAADQRNAASVTQAAGLGVGLLAAMFGLTLAFFLSRSIVRGVKNVQATLTSLTERCATSLEDGLQAFARNDLTVPALTVTEPIARYGADEIGETARVTNMMLAKVQRTIASYEIARASLAETLRSVRAASESVATSSAEVDQAATQSGNASTQIASTIGQVARGAADQARAGSDCAAAVQQLTRVIEQVEAGASATSRKVQAASIAVETATHAIARASSAAVELQPINATAQEAVARGSSAVDAAAAGMGRIRTAVQESALKVGNLGARSGQIGAIVETIDDIAEQTNLLALNAAIEAARAGDQGKGFAVVADEVRKLAERSSIATKEIAALIAEVQAGTTDAVRAMESGGAEVESGAKLAEESAVALRQITASAKLRDTLLAGVFSAVEEVRVATVEVVSASDSISVIADETMRAAQTMTAAADSVAHSIEAMAAVSEENSAAAQEVSAATEEMSAQAEEVVASAATLAEMAVSLDGLVGRFKMASSGSVPTLLDAVEREGGASFGNEDRLVKLARAS